jgi:hypothetical protein
VTRRGNRHRALRCALSFASLSGVGAARADVHRCEDARIQVASEVQPRWRAAIERACASLAALPGVDPSARVRIGPIDRDLAVEVTLADGRFASRRVVAPEALLATLEAVLVVPPSDPPADPPVVAEERQQARPPSNSFAPAWPRAEDSAPAPRLPPAESNVAVELGGGLGGRVAAHGYLSAAPAGFAEIRVGSWLLGALLRWDVIGSKSAPLVDVFEMETVVVGLVVARRVALGFGSIDAGLSPRLAVETQTFESGGGEQTLGATDVRLGTFARLAFGRSALRPIVEVDADLSPSRLRRVVQLDPRLPELPSWSAGLSAGLAWTAP